MTGDAARLVAGVLAQRLGVDATAIESSIGEDPFRVVMALSLMGGAGPVAAAPPASPTQLVAGWVGACPECLGENASCVQCQGSGKPGSREPDAAALVRWITPALQRVGLCIGRPRNPAVDTQRGGYIR